jgi:hypothetical protein
VELGRDAGAAAGKLEGQWARHGDMDSEQNRRPFSWRVPSSSFDEGEGRVKDCVDTNEARTKWTVCGFIRLTSHRLNLQSCACNVDRWDRRGLGEAV